MKRYLLLATLGTVLAASGCAGAKPNFAKAVNDVIGAATGPCAQDLIKASATCKMQYPGLPW
jgi:hypothetical protein